MQLRFLLFNRVCWAAAAIAWLLVAAWGNPLMIAQQPDSSISIQPAAILYADIPRTNCISDVVSVANTSQVTISVTVSLASAASNTPSSWSLEGIALDSLRRGVLDIPTRVPTSCGIRFCGMAAAGTTVRDTLIIRWGNAGSTQTRTVPLRATVTSAWAAPADTAFPNPVAIGGEDSLTILAVNRTNSPITITTARLDDPFGYQGFTMLSPSGQTTVDPLQALPVRVRFRPNIQSQSPIQNTILINDRNSTELRIGIQAQPIAPAAPPRLSDTILDFGTVAVGDCRTDSVTVNGGNTSFTIDTAWISGANSLDDPRYQIVSPTQFPVQNVFAVRFGIRFCPDPTGRITDTAARLTLRYRISGQNPQELVVQLYGRVEADTLLPPPTITPTRLDFGAVRWDTCVADTIIIAGDTIHQITRAECWRSNQQTDTRFTLVEPQSFPITLTPNGIRLVVRFCPDSSITDSAATLFLSTNWSNTPVAIPLTGHGVSNPVSPVERASVRLSGTTGQAGTTFQLPLTLSAPLRADQSVQSLFFRMRMPARALYPVGVATASGASIPHNYTVAYDADTAVGTLTAKFIGSITGQIVARIEFMGLTTGYPETVVFIDSVAVGSPFVAIDTANGIVELEGCEIGKGISFTKRAHVTSIRPSPITEATTIHYIAPDGTLPRLRLIDILGGTTRTIDLPTGTGREEQYHPDLHGVAPGLYLLELHVGSERTAMPVIITAGGAG
ncbi:MAG: hypothetical protein IT211_04745 [Armatimonadetes bacterium]|nr:hypothetical protein [Armatimonadota bacterium]